MENYLFDINNKNALALQREFNLRNNQAMEINYRFRPIISLKELSVNDFENLLEEEKNDFIKKRGKFMIDIFKRNYLESLIYDLEEYLDNIKKGKNKIYDFVNGTYFHWFKLELDKKYYTLLLSNKDETDLEIYFIDLLNCIKSFISKNENLMPQKKEDNFQDDLLNFSITVCSIPLDELSIQRLLYLDEELQDEFTISNCFLMQDLFINANENYTNAVLQNLSKAIQTNCGNNINLESVNIPENFGYGYTAIKNEEEKRISKIYENYKIIPPQQDQFKIIWLKTFIQDLKKIDFTIREILQLPQPTQETTPVKESETLSDLITHLNSVEIVEKIKIQYKNIKGKSLKLLLMAFQDLDLLPKERIASKFHKACKNEFNWNIASYNAMNNYEFNPNIDKKELEQKKSYLKSIIEEK